MNKKGATHVDWITSMAIFIIYILILLIFIKPNYKPVGEADALLEIVKNNFLKENSWNITKVPIILKNCVDKNTCGVSGNDPCVDYINDAVMIEVKSKLDDFSDKAYVFFDDGSSVDLEISGNNILLEVDQTKTTYWLFYSSDSAFVGGYENSNLEDNYHCIITIGEPIVYSGLLQSIPLLTYDSTLKNKWKFPISNDFKIIIYDNTGTPHYTFPSIEPPKDATIYSLDLKYPILKESLWVYPPINLDNTYIISIRVW